MSVAAIRRDHINVLDQPVAISGRFESHLKEDFVPEKDAFLLRTDFGDVVIILAKDKYTETLQKSGKGDEVKVYGTVTAVKPPGKPKTMLALEVE